MISKTVIIGLVAIAFVAGSIMTGTMVDAAKNKVDPLQGVLDAIAALQASVDAIGTSGLATQASVDELKRLVVVATRSESTYVDDTFSCVASNTIDELDCINRCDIDGSTALQVVSFDSFYRTTIDNDPSNISGSVIVTINIVDTFTDLTILCEKP